MIGHARLAVGLALAAALGGCGRDGARQRTSFGAAVCGVEVVRIALSTGAAERDTVPAFPAAFGAPGAFYARTNNRQTGEAIVGRYDRARAQ